MDTETTVALEEAQAKPARQPVREEMRPARGLLVGLVLAGIIWLGVLVFWLAL